MLQCLTAPILVVHIFKVFAAILDDTIIRKKIIYNQWWWKLEFSEKGINFHTGFLTNQKCNVLFLCGKHFIGDLSPKKIVCHPLFRRS